MIKKECRLMLRLSEELLSWIRDEGQKLGMDAATFARMIMMQRMTGVDPGPSIRRAAPLPSASAPHQAAYSTEIYEDEPAQSPEIDLDAILETASDDLFEVAQPGDMTAVQAVGPRRKRSPRDWGSM